MNRITQAFVGIVAFAGFACATPITFANFSQDVGLPNVFGFLNYTSSPTTSNGNLSINDSHNPCGVGNTCSVLSTLSTVGEQTVNYKIGSNPASQTQPSIVPGAVVPGAVAVTFQYESASVVSSLPLALQGSLAAHMNMMLFTTDAASSTKINSNDYFTIQPLDNGTISFDLDTPITSGVPGCTVAHPCSNLLTVTVSGSGGTPGLTVGLNGQRGTGTANLNGDVDANTDTFTFSSDFLSFSSQAFDQLVMGFTSIHPCFTQNNTLPSNSGSGAVSGCTTGAIASADLGNLLRTFDAAGEGSFASAPAPTVNGRAPEPSGVVFGLTGCLLVGLGMTRRLGLNR